MMYHLTSSMSDRVSFDEAIFVSADECIRAAEVPVWQIDADELAREQIEQINGFDVDDEEEAEARYMDAFRRAHRYALRSAVVDTATECGFDELIGLAESDFPLQRVTLLEMPSAESLDEAAGEYGGNPDGDLWLAPASKFNEDQLARAFAAGGRLVDGYAIPYPRSVSIEDREDAPLGPGWVALHGWCGYGAENVAYALDPIVAAAVYAASALKKKSEESEM